MEECYFSFAEMDAKEIKSKCLIALENIRIARERKVNILANELVEKSIRKANTWWGKIVGKRELLHFIAKGRVKDSPKMRDIELYASSAEEIAKAILTIANVSKSVFVSARDYKFIDGWSKP